MTLLFLIAAFFLLPSASFTYTSFAYANEEPIDPLNTYVLAIGSCPPWQSLKIVCNNDVELFTDTVVSTMGIPKENVLKLVDAEATYAGVVKGFEWLGGKAKDDSAIIIYYNGHGMLIQGIQAGDGKEEVFLLWSEAFPFAGLYAVMAKIWMTDEELAGLIEGVPGRAKVLVADTCHAGGAEEYLEKRGTKTDYGLNDAALLAATEAGQLALASGDYGLFTVNLTVAMRETSDLMQAFFQARRSTMKESRGICRELESEKSKRECKEQGPTFDDPQNVLRLFKLNVSGEETTKE